MKLRNKMRMSKEMVQFSLRVFRVWWRENPMLLLSVLTCGVIDSITPYVDIWLLARLIDEIAGGRDPQRLTTYVLALMGTTAVFSLLCAGLTRWKNVQLSCLWHTQNKVFIKKLLSMDFADMDNSHVQELRSRIWQNTDSGGWGLYKLIYSFDAIIRSVMSIISAILLTASLFILPVTAGSGGLTVLNHPVFILLIIAVMFGVTFAAPLLSVKAGSYWVKYADENQLGNRLFGFWLGNLGNDRSKALDIRIYRQDILSRNNLKKYNPFIPTSKLAKASRGPMGGYLALSGAVSQIFVGVAYIFVCLKALGGAFGVGAIVQYVSAIIALSGGLSMLIETLGDLKNNTPFLRTVFEFLDIPNKMSQGDMADTTTAAPVKDVSQKSGAGYNFEFRNVSFRYPGQENYALRNVSMTFRAGQRLAVVGMNGSGKTTFIKLLCRLYDPTEGEILLNGIDIRKYDYHEYMQLFSVVFQDFKLLSFELGQNVAGNRNVDLDKADQCLRDAGFGIRLDKLCAGLLTSLYKDFDEKGVDISGGEAQKIALARALYKDAQFIILDEPTAALDPIAEFEVYNRMDQMIGEKSAVFISHRLSSCRFCNDIAVFHMGRLIQRGSHDVLVSDKSGMYYRMWSAQAQYFQKDSTK
ncbi:MAG: ABC transporter ATP-binding protein/permease [Lachnospiraceae bacterium]|nr:ABC transporter ATP-binding protein/permease [Lachnospiraceae bacterium]